MVNSIDAALAECKEVDEVMVMGGASLYEQLLPQADKLYLTYVDAELEGDTWFPKWDKKHWLEVSREDHPSDDKNQYPYSFVVYDRIN